MRNITIYLLLTLLVAGCSGTSEPEQEAEPTEQEPMFSEYLTCTPGSNFNADNVRAMIRDWNQLDLSNLIYAAGHAPVAESSLGGEGKVYWQLFWESKEVGDEAWSQPPSEEFAAWGEKYADVLTCDGDGRRGYDAYWGRDNDRSGEWADNSQWVTYAHYCKFTENGNLESLGAAAEAFNEYVDNSETGDDGPFTFAVYLHNGDNPEVYSQYDFFWMNYYQNNEDAQASYARFAENGGEMQAQFDAISNCEGPYPSNSYQFLYE